MSPRRVFFNASPSPKPRMTATSATPNEANAANLAEKVQTLRSLTLVAAWGLCLAILPIWPYGYYMLLRLIMCGATAYCAWTLPEIPPLRSQRVPLILVAFLFNPVLPVHLIRLIWLPIDMTCAVYLFVLSRKLKQCPSNLG
jgi:hypothetical protein